MDIWNWVRARRQTLLAAGDTRLAELLYALPEHVTNLRHHQVDALVPEAVALAKGREDPWLELYFRHWELQSLVLTRMHGEDALSTAVSLVDFSHRPETEGCPQSVCSVQDLAACYGIVDGPGWAPERIEVTAETLARIDPTWGCFDCISSEHADALIDADRPEEAQAFLLRQLAAKLAKDGGDPDDRFCGLTRVAALSALSRDEDALALIERQMKGRPESKNRELMRRVQRARLLARLGRFDESKAELPSFQECFDGPDLYPRWSECALALVRAGVLANDGRLGHALGTMAARLDKNGAVRSALAVAERHGELCLARGALWSARRALSLMESLVPRLRSPLSALDSVRSMRAAVERASQGEPVALPESPEALLDELFAPTENGRDVERDLPVMEASVARWPEHDALRVAYADALFAAGAREESLAVLDARLREGVFSEAIVLRLGQALLREDGARFDAYERAVEAGATDERVRVLPAFLRAAWSIELERWGEARALLERVVKARSDGNNARRMLARSLVRLGGVDNARAALGHLETIEANGAFDRADHWARMMAASVADEWAIVRASAAALEMGLAEGEGPIDEPWEICFLSLETEDGRRELIAGRTGPVTARVLFVAGAGEPSEFGDEWVFDARPLNEAPGADADDEAKRRHRWVYPAVWRKKLGGFRTVECDGARPTEEQLDALGRALASSGIEMRTGGGEAYRLKDPRDERAEVPAVYVRLAVPAGVSDREVSELLQRETQGFALPFAWSALAVAIGDEALVNEHRARSKAYGVEDGG